MRKLYMLLVNKIYQLAEYLESKAIALAIEKQSKNLLK